MTPFAPLRAAWLFTLAVVACPLHAQTAPPLRETVVTATRTATRADELVSDVRVIDRAAIEASTARTLPELLTRLGGVQMSATGGRGKTSSVSIRGAEDRHTLLLVDGVRIGSATQGTPTWEGIPLEMIERIEVLKGPASALYGSDGVGGVVQVFTRKGRDGFHPYASLAAGSREYWRGAVGVQAGSGPLNWSLSLQREGERGISSTRPEVRPTSNYNPDVDPFRQDSVSGSASYDLGAGWSVDGSLLHSDGVTHFDEGGLNIDRSNAIRALVAQAGAKGRLLPGWQTELRLSQSRDTTNALVARPANFSAFSTEQTQWSWLNTVETAAGALLLGLEDREQRVASSQAFPVRSRSIRSAFAGLNGQRGAHSWQGNLRRDANTQFGDADTWFAGYGFRLTDAWRLHASRGTSFAAPSFNQLYFPGFGNPALRPERGVNTDVGVTWTGGAHEVKLVRFDNRLRDMIVNASTPAGLRPQNVNRARIEGWTLGYEGAVGPVKLRGSAERLDPRDETTGLQLRRRAREQYTAGADWRTGAWGFGAALLHAGNRVDYPSGLPAQRLRSFTTADLHADWNFARDLSLQFKVNNVGDVDYQTAYGYNQPGRSAYVTLRWQPR